jgi:hypothetical protein
LFDFNRMSVLKDEEKENKIMIYLYYLYIFVKNSYRFFVKFETDDLFTKCHMNQRFYKESTFI